MKKVKKARKSRIPLLLLVSVLSFSGCSSYDKIKNYKEVCPREISSCLSDDDSSIDISSLDDVAVYFIPKINKRDDNTTYLTYNVEMLKKVQGANYTAYYDVCSGDLSVLSLNSEDKFDKIHYGNILTSDVEYVESASDAIKRAYNAISYNSGIDLENNTISNSALKLICASLIYVEQYNIVDLIDKAESEINTKGEARTR